VERRLDGEAIRAWIGARWKGPRLFQLCALAVILLVVVLLLAVYPAGLPPWRFFGAILALVLLLLLNIFALRPAARPAAQCVSLCASELLVLSAAGLSGQPSVDYLAAIVCGQAVMLRGLRAGIGFGAATLVALPVLQLFLSQPVWAIIGNETGLAAGTVFVLILVSLLRRYARQTSRSEALALELQAANGALAAAHAKELEVARAEERMRLAHDLHDSVSQLLYSVALYAEAAVDSAAAGRTEVAARHMRDVRSTARDALREMRLLVFELHGPTAEASGLTDALRARIEAVEARGGMSVDFSVDGDERVPPVDRTELYHIAQEALNNALRHARATALGVHLCFRGDAVRIEISDDGVGFPPGVAAGRGGFGIPGMRERAARIGASLLIDSAPGAGARISVCAPFRESSADGGVAHD
jgi:signal transduction histidine kinase